MGVGVVEAELLQPENGLAAGAWGAGVPVVMGLGEEQVLVQAALWVEPLESGCL